MSTTGSVSHWINLLKEGDGAAVERLWKSYFPRLVGLARKKLREAPRRAADEEDVALSAFDSFCDGAAGGRFPQLTDRDDLWLYLLAGPFADAAALVAHFEARAAAKGQHDLVILDGASGEPIGSAAYLNIEPGQAVQTPVSDGKRVVSARIEAQQREDVKTPAGSFKTVRYEIFLFNNVLWKRSGHLYIWLTDDRRRIPVQIRVRLPFTIGTITLQLEKVE